MSTSKDDVRQRALELLRKRLPNRDKVDSSPIPVKRKKETPDAEFKSPESIPSDDIPDQILVKRSPVLILWVATLAHKKLEYSWAESLSIGSSVAASISKDKGHRLGIFRESVQKPSESINVEGSINIICSVPYTRRMGNVRGISADGTRTIDPLSVSHYLAGAFGEDLSAVYTRMSVLASRITIDQAYAMYSMFRPPTAPGRQGWGIPGVLDLAAMRDMTLPVQVQPKQKPKERVKVQRSKVLEFIEGSASGVTMEAICTRFYIGDGDSEWRSKVEDWLDELQLEGLVYSDGERFLPL